MFKTYIVDHLYSISAWIHSFMRVNELMNSMKNEGEWVGYDSCYSRCGSESERDSEWY